MNSLRETYVTSIVPQLMKSFGIDNRMAAPKLVKIVINCGMGEALRDEKSVEKMATQLSIITGQKPMVTKSKKAISTFKLREGVPIGLKVTLRGTRMYDFLTKLIAIALPRVRDFRGIPMNGFDGKGNYTLGISEQTIFPDLEYGMVDKVRGLEITFVSTAKTDKEALMLLTLLGMPFTKEGTHGKNV